LDGLSLRVEPGEVTALLGSNGAGKSTTIGLFLGFISPTAGKALVDGVSVATSTAVIRSKLAYVLEAAALYPSLTGVETLQFFADLAGGPRPPRARRSRP
jgi:ABC-2 type transport system ATP-binding protein